MRAGGKSVPMKLHASVALAVATLLAGFCLPARSADDEVVRVSLYYLALEDDYPPGADGVFRDGEGRSLYRGSSEYLAKASIEGAARTRQGEVLAFDPENPAAGWRWSRSRWGEDALGCPLIPYRSAAVPPEVPLGTVLYIPETVGLPLPDGSRHDGRWYATDRGVGIVGDRIDLFMAAGLASMHAGERFGLDYLHPVHVRPVGQVKGCRRT